MGRKAKHNPYKTCVVCGDTFLQWHARQMACAGTCMKKLAKQNAKELYTKSSGASADYDPKKEAKLEARQARNRDYKRRIAESARNTMRPGQWAMSFDPFVGMEGLENFAPLDTYAAAMAG